ncbi:NACHT domain-containing protein [Kitasatospora sp. NPDC058965]|uniref:NACHT domain-containing protein n=1 Tax=Kitasatospora sp. NPDC058965 TaxID=3346682 RepID=UPI0036D0F313
MPGGRPSKGVQQRYPELAELADWFRQALLSKGYRSANAFVQAGLFDKALVYDLHNAARLPTLAALRAFAGALDRDPAEVVPIWQRAKLALERSAAAQRAAETARLESWDQLPQPGPLLRNLLEAQAASVDRLPYDVLDVVEPPLSAIYVRQQVRAQSLREAAGSGEDDRKAKTGTAGDRQGTGVPAPDRDTVLPATDVLDRHVHLLVTGEPGSGKSTLANHLTWLLARIWLRATGTAAAPTAEPLVPLRIAARTLVGEGSSWSAALCEATRRSLGHSLIAEPEPGLFTGRVQGSRWLVLVDGLDEVTDRQERAGIIRAVAQHARADSAYRFLITSRPLPESELAPLRAAGFGGYRMEPFSEAELRHFAEQWFTAQDAEGPAAGRFLQEVADGRLKELVRNPLLATIAAVGATLEPDRALPSNRVSLYRRFLEHLLRRTGSQPQLLLEALGRHRIEQDGSLRAAARAWAREQGLTTDERELHQTLLGTGLLVQQGEDLRFLHHSFAEFLAALSYAREIPADFPDLATWVRRAGREAEQTLAVFTFRLWAERAECSADLIIDHLLDGVQSEHYTLAGQLIAEGAAVGAERRARLVERLEADARNDPNVVESAIQAMAALTPDPAVVQVLRRLSTAPELSTVLRLLAVGALTRCVPVAEAEQLLATALSDTYGLLPRAATISLTVSSAAQEAVRQRAAELAERPWHHNWDRARMARALEIIGCTAEAVEQSRRLLADPSAEGADRAIAAEAWLRAAPDAAPAIRDLAVQHRGHLAAGAVEVARVLQESGATEEARRTFEAVLVAPETTGYYLQQVAQQWPKSDKAADRRPLLEAFHRCGPAAGHERWYTADLLRAAAESGATEEAARWARTAVAGLDPSPVPAALAVAVWLAAEGPGAAPEIMQLLEDGDRVEPFNLARTAEELLNGGARSAARVLAQRALRTPHGAAGYYERAAGVLLKIDAAEALEVLAAGLAQSAPDVLWTVGVLTALIEQDGDAWHPLARRLTDEVLASPHAADEHLVGALAVPVLIDGRAQVKGAVELALSHPRIGVAKLREFARTLASIGERRAALRIWRDVMANIIPPHDEEWRLLEDLEQAGAVPEALGWIEELLGTESSPAKRLRLRQMRAWLRASAEPEDGPADGPDRQARPAPPRLGFQRTP